MKIKRLLVHTLASTLVILNLYTTNIFAVETTTAPINNKSVSDNSKNLKLEAAVVNVTSVSLNKTTDTLTVGGFRSLTAVVLPANATNKAVKWTSSDKSVASVDSTGKVTAISAGRATITVTTANGNKTASCVVTVNKKKGYVYNTNFQIDLNVRSSPGLNGAIIGRLYNNQRIEILAYSVDSNNNVWDKIIYNGGYAYVSNAYIQPYTSPPDSVVTIARNITKQFEVGTSNQIAGNFDGQGLSLGYFQWCIGQGTLQPLLNRMDRQYNSEMRSIFGANYSKLHNIILDTPSNQLKWAKGINNSTNKIVEPWYSQFVLLSKNQHFINIEQDSEAYFIKQAMIICDKYKLRTIRGFALALDIVVQNGSVNSNAAKIIDAALSKNPSITEKALLGVIANAVADSSPSGSADIRSRKMAIVNGKGNVHETMVYLDANYGLRDSYWR
ncbi:MAG: Ig-like domain-containing protein [Clostridiaceae bacterium]